MYFLASKLLWFVAAPLNVLLLAAMAGVLLGLTRFRRTGWWLTLGSLVSIIALGMLPVGSLLLRGLEDAVPAWRDDGGPVAGIIVLGGGFDGSVALYRNQFSINEAGERLTAMASLARQRPDVPVVFTGGSGRLGERGPGEAGALKPFLAELGLPEGRVILEGASRNTLENALFTRDLLKPRPGDRFILVTSAAHMPRSVGLFRAAGFTVLPWPVDYRTSAIADDPISFSVAGGLSRLEAAVREWIGLIAARALGQTKELFPSP